MGWKDKLGLGKSKPKPKKKKTTKSDVVKVADKWTPGEGLEEAFKRAEEEIKDIDHLFDPTAPKSREGYRTGSKGVRAKLRTNNEARKKRQAKKLAELKKQKEEAEREQRRANWRKLKGLD